MKNTLALLVMAVVMATVARAGELVEFAAYDRAEFSPARGEQFRVPVRLKVAAEVELRILTSDGDLVRTLKSPRSWTAGDQEFSWDGKDDDGVIVADEAYVPVLAARAKDGRSEEIDPRAFSGGETVGDLKVETAASGDITYTLPAPSRVLIRVGIKDGPMMRSLATWAPRGAGRNVQRWNGFDQDRLVDLRSHPRLSVLATAFRLPQQSILTVGNPDNDYRAYRKEKGWPEKAAPATELKLERNGQRLSRSYFLPRFKDPDPRVTLSLIEKLPLSRDQLPVIAGPVTLRVDIPEEDRWLVQESLYEVAFFVDQEFVSEEEHGYVPFSWRWTPSGLAAGRHLLTVNISGFGGKVAVRNLLFEIPE
ncbi:FlgD immunoglobulin-like domain containing protein [Candidatus Accumulibacter vicinus]|uniref:Flagellar basal body rod modification protein n=1 Tax=Candidatus Accumulibacter vicinus TaxID=2954382 RepID=A0A084Y4X0_9PROT|nr:FlgD immunoglobulin-like domain containing protein [Candidatus Accumulibacter vicinus]KFB69764.1 MAG: flagellar basal body rod modification protein [Candidatus Accumulibacter vicinus]